MRTVGRQGPLVINAALAAIVTMAMLFLTANMPLVIAVLAYCARLVVTLPAGIGLLRSAAGLSVRDQVGAVVMPIFASTIMFAAVWVSRAYLLQDLLMLWRLLFEILIGAVVYIGAALLFDRKRCVEEARFWLTKGAALANVKPAHRREK